MTSSKKLIYNRILTFLIISVVSLIPLIIWPFGEDYFYYPKIILIYILIAFGIVTVFIFYIMKIIELKLSKEFIPLILFGIMIILSALFSQYKEQAFWGAHLRYEGAVAYISYFLIAYFAFLCADSVEGIRTILKFMFFSSAVISVYAVFQYMGFDIIQRDEIRKGWNFTSFATLGNPNFLGSYLSLVFPTAVFMYLNTNKRINKYLLFILCLILYSALICTKTRSAWVGTAFSLFVLFLLFIKKIIKYRYRIIVLIISFAIVTYSLNIVHSGLISAKFNSLVSDYNAVVNKKQYSSNLGSQRLFIWSRTLEYVFERPLLGSGPDTLDKIFEMSTEEALYHFGSSEVYVDKAHNEYLQILVTMGFPALIFYLSFLIMLLYKTVRAIATKTADYYSVGIFSGIMAYLVQAFFNISVVSVAPVYWAMIGMLIATYRFDEQKPSV